MPKLDQKNIMNDVLDSLMEDMDNYEYDKKLKPKVIQITIDTSGGMMMPEGEGGEDLGELEELFGGGTPEPMEEENPDDDVDPRLMKKIRGKMGDY